MSLINTFKKLFQKTTTSQTQNASNLSSGDIGIDKAVCPYCDYALDKMPGSKKKCPSCNNFIFVRTRPKDNKKILIREDQILKVEELWAIKNGTHEEFLAEIRKNQNIKLILHAELGRDPNENEIKWRRLKDDLVTHAENYEWGLYRNARLNMGDILKKEAKYLEALDTYFEVCYIDLNGPNNCGTKDPEILKQYPPFDPSSSFLAPGVIAYIDKMLEQTGFGIDKAKERFLEVSQRVRSNLNLPLNEKSAWKKLEKEFK